MKRSGGILKFSADRSMTKNIISDSTQNWGEVVINRSLEDSKRQSWFLANIKTNIIVFILVSFAVNGIK